PREFGTGAMSDTVAAADFDLDGRAEVAVINRATSDVSLLHAEGAGGFAAPVAGWFFDSMAPSAVGDLNHDGYPDLVKRNWVRIADGAGGFAFETAYMDQTMVTGIAIGTVDADAHPDLVVTRGTNAVIVLRGDGTGAFPGSTSAPLSAQPEGPVLGDFNEDGKTDVVVT